MIRSTKVSKLKCKEDLEHCELWDEKEEFINGHSRSREREADKIKSVRHGDVRRYRLRSRRSCRSNDNLKDMSSDGSKERYGKYKAERRRKEKVKW